MSAEAAAILAAVAAVAAAAAALCVLQRRASKSAALFEERLRDVARLAGEMRERQEAQGRLLAEGQARQMEALQSQFVAAVESMNRQLTAVTGALNEQLSETRGDIGRRLEGTRRVVTDVSERLGELSATARRMHDLGRDIARLQDVLQAPKLRGNIGELFLEELLAQVLPAPHYRMQHTFSSGEKVDAVIRLGEQLVPVDSKFPLESFNRIRAAESEEERRRARREFAASVRRRIDEVATKYIRPGEGTYDFALMYIPAENVFYEVILREEAFGEEAGLFNYALKRHVVPVSPNSFYAYLMAVAYGLRGLQIEKQAQEIRGRLGEVRGAIEKFTEDFLLMGRHLENARTKYNDTERRLGSLREGFERLEGDGANGQDRGIGDGAP